jgi:hypothetical protein
MSGLEWASPDLAPMASRPSFEVADPKTTLPYGPNGPMGCSGHP